MNIHEYLVKEAAPRHIKDLRKLMEAGDTAGAKSLVAYLERIGKLKYTSEGTNILRLKGGAEAVPHIVVGVKGKKGLQVRKVYDEKGPMFSKRHLGLKKNVVRRYTRRSENVVPTSFHKGKGGARYSISPFIDTSNPAQLRYQFVAEDQMSKRLVDLDEKADHINKVLRPSKKVTPADIYAAREKKRAPIIEELKRRGVPEKKARKRALKMVPEFGGAHLQDLHSGNVFVDKDNTFKIVDFNPVGAKARARQKSASDKERTKLLLNDANLPFGSQRHLMRAKQTRAKTTWKNELSGKVPHASDLDHNYGLYGNTLNIQGLVGGPKASRSGKDLHALNVRTLGGLGTKRAMRPENRRKVARPTSPTRPSSSGNIDNKNNKSLRNTLAMAGIGVGGLSIGKYLYDKKQKQRKAA